MADNNKVQLKREELVGDEVVLSDINPLTDTPSVEDTSKGIPLSMTLEQVWSEINNKVAREVNSVNGRTGVVVLSSDDVGLGNVDNVSFDDIKKWVIEQIAYAFKVHQIQLFDSLEEVAEYINTHDETYSGTPFFSEHGYVHPSMSYPDLKSYIGYFEYDPTTEKLVAYMKPINSIGATDNSIIYNTKIGDKDFRGGKIGVNIYRYENALKLYNANSGETATDASLLGSGLYIDKTNLLPQLRYFNGCYGDGTPSDPEAFLYFQGAQESDSTQIQFTMNGVAFLSSKTIYTKQTFNLYDLIYCNFDDENCYKDPFTGPPAAKTGILPDLLLRQPCIGQVVQVPTELQPSLPYVVRFVSIKQYVSYGLTYMNRPLYPPGYQDIETDNILAISPLQGKVSSDSYLTQLSGLTLYNDDSMFPGVYPPSAQRCDMSTPMGNVNVLDGIEKSNNGVVVNVNDGLCMIPAGSDTSNMPLKNFPKALPHNNTSMVGGFIAPNLMKQVYTGQSDNKYGFNMSGLRITKHGTTGLDSTWFGRECDDWDESPTHSGGLSVNVGDFLSIGKSGELSNDSGIMTRDTFYDIGKVNVNIDETRGLYNAGNNKIGIKVAQPVTFTEVGNMLTVNRGAGIMASNCYNQYGTRLPNGTDEKALAVALVDSKTGVLDWGPESDGTPTANVQKMYGGLRYIPNPYVSGKGVVIGLRINAEAAWDDGIYSGSQSAEPPLRMGDKAICIDENNIVGVQLYKDTEDPNPLLIKGKVVHEILLPSFSGADYVTAQDASMIDDDYANILTTAAIECYVNKLENKAYSDYTRIHEIQLTEGSIYADLTAKPAILYEYLNGQLQYMRDSANNVIDSEWVSKADVDHDGSIDSSDASTVRVFISYCEDNKYTNDLAGFKQFLWDEFKITDNYDHVPGLMVRYNTHEGIIAHDSGPEIRDKNTLSISIKDYSNGYTGGESYDPSDPTPQSDRNGLRFATGGMLSVKVNDTEGYLSTTQGGRLIVDTDTGVGTKGLCIDGQNVLGVQLATDGSTDNGYLALDQDGCLTISDSFRPVMDITLGPGLIWGE